MSEPLSIKLSLPNSPETIYSALTDPRQLEAWFSEGADVSVPDARYDFWGRFTPEVPGREQGRHPLLLAEDGRRLQYHWRLAGQDTLVEFELQPQTGQTRVLLTHGGPTPNVEAGIYAPEDFWFLSLENLRRYVDGRPEAVVRCDFSASQLGDINLSVEIDGSADAVFDVLIRPDQLQRWIASQPVVEPFVGGRYDFGWGGGGPHKIVEFAPGERLAYAWEESTPTIVTWTLAESGGRTRLTLVHRGFAPDKNNADYNLGWLNFLSWIKSIVEYGAGWQPPIKRMAPEHYRYYPAVIGQAQAV